MTDTRRWPPFESMPLPQKVLVAMFVFYVAPIFVWWDPKFAWSDTMLMLLISASLWLVTYAVVVEFMS